MGRFSNALAYAGASIRTREPVHGKLTPGEANVRVPVRVSPHEAPDPIRQGAVPTRRAMVQVATFFHDTQKVSEGRFVAIVQGPSPRAQFPRGRMLPWTERSNIAVPPHVAYGSMFTSAQPTYGLG